MRRALLTLAALALLAPVVAIADTTSVFRTPNAWQQLRENWLVGENAQVAITTPTPTPTATPTPTPTPTPGGDDLPPLGEPSCVPGAVNVTTANAVASNLAAQNDVCVTANVGNVSLSGGSWTSSNVEYLGTSGAGRIGHMEINGVRQMVIRARFTSATIRDSRNLTIEQSKIGGDGPTDRTNNQLLFLPDTLDGTYDVTIRDNEIAWTCADNTGNTGYGIRAYGDNHRLIIQRNWIHDLASDAIQGLGGEDVLVDRNEIGPVGQCPGSEEHSDNIQITGNDSNLRITNNYIHGQGYWTNDDGELENSGNSGVTYVHGGGTNTMLIENNLFANSRGRVEFCGLGTGGTSRSNVTIRQNTFYDLGRAFSNFPGFEWDCDTGTGNVIERNIAVDPDGGFDMGGSSGTVTSVDNLFGQLNLVTLDDDWNCTSVNCTTDDEQPIGFRKPDGVHW